MSLLARGLPAPLPARDGLDRPYWEGARAHQLKVQRCADCGTWRWGPEWICHGCRSFATEWVAVEPAGRVHAWERVWHPVHPALAEAVPYVVVLVELPQAGDVRMIGNLVGDPLQAVHSGARVRAVFEDQAEADAPYTLVQWKLEEEPT